ncbi:MAG: hypothetical protein HC763_24540 [Hydrococcus sp. CRU_1_1]|nr:hypothetical protein [Hydrococcus sp. CRU_1_1]
MSEEKGELDKSSPSETPSPSDAAFDENITLAKIEERLVQATSPEEIDLWMWVRGEIIRQNEVIKDNKHQRSLEKLRIIRKTSLSGVAITIGIGFVISGLNIPGLLILGVAFYELASNHSNFRPSCSPKLGGTFQSPPRLGDLGGRNSDISK